MLKQQTAGMDPECQEEMNSKDKQLTACRNFKAWHCEEEGNWGKDKATQEAEGESIWTEVLGLSLIRGPTLNREDPSLQASICKRSIG